MDTLEVINPTIIFVIAKAKLDIIPTIPARFPYLFIKYDNIKYNI